MYRSGYKIFNHSAKSSFIAYKYSSLDLKGLKDLCSTITAIFDMEIELLRRTKHTKITQQETDILD